MLLPIALCLLTQSPTQSPCEVILADSAGDQLARLADFDGDGRILDLGEAWALWRESANLTPRALAVEMRGGTPSLSWIDSAKDRIHHGMDVNDNGSLELFERRVLRDSGKLDGASTARAMTVTEDGAVWWCSDAGLRGLFRMRDLDGDGFTAGALELEVLVGAGGSSHPIETALGLRAMDVSNFAEVEALGDRVVTYSDGPDELMCVFRPANDDGDLVDPGESRLFLNASGKNPSMPQNVDWASGVLRDLTIPSFFGGSFYGRLSLLSVDESGTTPTWYFACDSAYRSPYDTNVDQLGLNGLIYRGVDLNGDGDLQDAGEVGLYYDGSHTSSDRVLEQIDAIDACGGALYVAYNEAGRRYVARFVDINGDGRASGGSEANYDWFDDSIWSKVAPFEKAAPFIRDMIAIPSGTYARANPLYYSMGPGCEYTDFGNPPTLHTVGRAEIGTKTFKVELRGAAAGSYAVLLAGDDYPAWFTHWLPANLGFFGLPNCTQYLNPTWLVEKWTTGVVGDPIGGYAKYLFKIPLDAELIGFRMRLQWIVYDWFGGVSLSGGGEVELEAPQ